MASCIICGAYNRWTKQGAECMRCFSDRFTTYDTPFAVVKIITGDDIRKDKDAIRYTS
jgi:hypothetical protein